MLKFNNCKKQTLLKIKIHHGLMCRLMGGRQVDFALKKVTFNDQVYLFSILLFESLRPGLLMLRFFNSYQTYLRQRVYFQGSAIMGYCYLILLVYSFRGESLKLRALNEEIIIYESYQSCVDGNSSKNSFLPFLVAVVSFLVLSIGKASLLGSSLVQNLRLYNLVPLLFFPVLFGYCSSKQPKNDVFSGEQCNLYDSAFLYFCEVYCRSWGRLSLTDGMFLVGYYLFWKKSTGSLFLLILIRLIRPFGSLNR